jgi:NADP-dependent 3-hydroxy acid dehydrogenase YdfG
MAIAVVTGAANGIGRAIAQQATARGMTLALVDWDKVGLDKLCSELGSAVVASEALDLRDAGAIANFAERTREAGAVDLVFANAGIVRMGSIASGDVNDWSAMIDVNLKGTLNTIAAFVPAMVSSPAASRIIITGSESSFDASPTVGIYSATKHALWAVAEALYHDLAAAGVSHVAVSLLVPGIVNTRIANPNNAGGHDPLLDGMDRTLRELGVDPAEMARVAFEGIDDGRFYIFFRPEAADALVARAACVRSGRPMAPRLPDLIAVTNDQ